MSKGVYATEYLYVSEAPIYSLESANLVLLRN